MTKNSIINRENDLKQKPLNDLYTGQLLNNLQTGEQTSLDGENGSFVFYKNDENGFGVEYNSAGINFVNNPMTKDEMANILSPVISHADTFEGKIPNDLLIRLKNMFWGNDEKLKSEKLTVEILLKNISLENIFDKLDFNKQLLNETEHKLSNGIVEYLQNATKILDELILQYPENSVIKNKIQEKKNYLESYKKTFSDGKFIEGIQKNVSDLEKLLDILEEKDGEGELVEKIKELRNRKDKKDSSAEINTFFDKIYAWDAFAIPYYQFARFYLGGQYGLSGSLDQGTRAFAELNGWDKGSSRINRLGKKQELLMDDKLSFEQKKEAFQNANQEYLDSVGFILGTGRNALPSTGGYYKGIHDEIEVDKFISMPCSDVYPAILQRTILPFYLEDLYKDTCELLREKNLDKSIDKYIDELKNPSGFAKLTSKLKNNDQKIESLKNISEKIRLLRKKFDNLDKQIKDFGDKKKDGMTRGDDEIIKMASEFSIIEDFVKIDNTNMYSPYTMSNQDKRLEFMRKN